MSVRYYGGSSAFDGKQYPLEASNFTEFVERYINVPNAIRMSRREYHGADDLTRKKFKDGPFFTACSFKEGTEKRNDDNADSLNLIILDIDALSEQDSEEGYLDYATDLVESEGVIANALAPFNHVASETASSRPGARCLRIVVECEPCELKWHKPMVATIARMMGMQLDKWKGFRESNVISQPMYRPPSFVGEDFCAVISTVTNNEQLTEYDVPQDIEDDNLALADLSYKDDSGNTYMSLEHMPILDLTLEEVEEALYCIDPDVDYGKWVKIVAALRHQFRGEEADEAYEMFDQWSSEGAKYRGDDDTAAKWRSIRPDTTGKAPVTVRSLFKIAQDQGWKATRLASKFKQSLEEWMVQCRDGDALMREGPERIASLPFTNKVVEDGMVVRLREAIKACNGPAIEKSVIRQSVRSERRKSLKDAPDETIPPWARPWVFNSPENNFYNMDNGLVLSVQAFNNTYSKELMSEADEGMAGRPAIAPADYFLNVLQMQRVEGVIYDPRQQGAKPFFTYDGKRYLNEFLPSSLPAEVPDQHKKAGRMFKKLLRVIFGNPEYEKHVLHFLAHTVQKPGHKIRWAVIVQSAEGSGKSYLADIMIAVLGVPNVKIVEPDSLLDKYNDWTVGSCMTFIEEIFVPGPARVKVSNAMKTSVTNDKISLREKFKGMRVALNTANMMAFTNFHNPLSLTQSDRRYMVVESPLQTKEDVIQVNESGLWDELEPLKRVEKGLAGALRYYLLNLEIPDDFPVNGPAPFTEFRQQAVVESKPEIVLEIEDLIDDPDQVLISDDVISTKALTEELGPIAINRKVSTYLRQLGYQLYKDGKRFRLAGGRGTIWVHRTKYMNEVDAAEELLASRLGQHSENDFESE